MLIADLTEDTAQCQTSLTMVTNLGFSERVSVAVTLITRIREVLGSTFGATNTIILTEVFVVFLSLGHIPGEYLSYILTTAFRILSSSPFIYPIIRRCIFCDTEGAIDYPTKEILQLAWPRAI
jgi:hypothetical protein